MNSADSKRSSRTNILGVLLTLVAVTGIFLLAFAAIVLPFVSQVGALKPEQYLLIGSKAAPFVFYLWAIVRRWTRKKVLYLGIPIHAVWLPAAFSAGEDLTLFLVFFLGVVPCFALFVAYACSLPTRQN